MLEQCFRIKKFVLFGRMQPERGFPLNLSGTTWTSRAVGSTSSGTTTRRRPASSKPKRPPWFERHNAVSSKDNPILPKDRRDYFEPHFELNEHIQVGKTIKGYYEKLQRDELWRWQNPGVFVEHWR